MFSNVFGVLHFEKSLNMPNILAKNEEKPCLTCLKPKTRVSGILDSSLVYYPPVFCRSLWRPLASIVVRTLVPKLAAEAVAFIRRFWES